MLVGRTPGESMARVPNFEQAGYVNQTGLSRKVPPSYSFQSQLSREVYEFIDRYFHRTSLTPSRPVSSDSSLTMSTCYNVSRSPGLYQTACS